MIKGTIKAEGIKDKKDKEIELKIKAYNKKMTGVK